VDNQPEVLGKVRWEFYRTKRVWQRMNRTYCGELGDIGWLKNDKSVCLYVGVLCRCVFLIACLYSTYSQENMTTLV